MKTLIAALFFIVTAASTSAIEGFDVFKFGMSYEQVKKLSECKWEPQDITFTGFMITQSSRADLYKCRDFLYEGQKVEFYTEYIDQLLQRIIIDVSGSEGNIISRLEKFKQVHGFKNGKSSKKGRSTIYHFDDPTVEVEVYEAPLNLMYIRFYSEDYEQLIRQPSLKILEKYKA